MRKFDYSKFENCLWDNEILRYLTQIHEHKGRQELFSRQRSIVQIPNQLNQQICPISSLLIINLLSCLHKNAANIFMFYTFLPSKTNYLFSKQIVLRLHQLNLFFQFRYLFSHQGRILSEKCLYRFMSICIFGSPISLVHLSPVGSTLRTVFNSYMRHPIRIRIIDVAYFLPAHLTIFNILTLHFHLSFHIFFHRLIYLKRTNPR